MTVRSITSAVAFGLLTAVSSIALVSSAHAQFGPTPGTGAGFGGPAGAFGFGAPPQTQSTVEQVVVEGNQRIEADTVRAYMVLRSGDPFDAVRMDDSLKSLFATGLFADVSLQRRGNALVVRVVENPIINRIAFEGNRRIEDDTLETEVQLRPRQVYTRARVQADVQRILDAYRRTGRYAVTVEPKIIELDQNRVDLAFEIDEGQRTYIRRISFVGNDRFSDAALREVVASREERWYRFFSSADTYDPDRLTFDRELLRRHYLRQGYADFRVISGVAELTADRSAFFVTFSIDEGERYKFGDLSVSSVLPDVAPEDLQGAIVARSGEWYNADEVENSIQAITSLLGEKGYAFVDVRPRVQRDAENHVVNIVFDVQEGPRVFVDRIEITGNVRTLDHVIRREFLLVEGDAFNSAKLRRSQERVQNLRFFEDVRVNTRPSDTAPDRTVIEVDVQEQSTGELSFGVGWSSGAGGMFQVGLRERNLLGRGQDLTANFMLAQRRQEVDFSFTEPYFLDRRLAAGIDIFATRTDLQDEASYDTRETGAALRLGYNYTDRLSQSLRYTISRSGIENIRTDASPLIRAQSGTQLLSMISQSLLYDRRDSVVDPRNGYFGRLSTDFAGLGGEQRFIRGVMDGGIYFGITDESTLVLEGMVGAIGGLGGQDVRFNQNFNLGGDNMRGFAYGGGSPRLIGGLQEPVGGKWIATGTAELRFPLGLPEELGIGGKAFTDVGVVGKPDGVPAGMLNYSARPRAAIGVGLTWRSPMGPLSIDFSHPIIKERFDKTEVFRFSFGTRF